VPFSFDINLGTARDRVRFKIGDTRSAEPLLEDETINALLVIHSNDETRTAVSAARAALAFLAEKTDRTAVGQTTARSQRFEQMRVILEKLEADLNAMRGGLRITGTSKADRETVDADDDYIKPAFGIGRDENR
jgi:hypothetical protein